MNDSPRLQGLTDPRKRWARILHYVQTYQDLNVQVIWEKSDFTHFQCARYQGITVDSILERVFLNKVWSTSSGYFPFFSLISITTSSAMAQDIVALDLSWEFSSSQPLEAEITRGNLSHWSQRFLTQEAAVLTSSWVGKGVEWWKDDVNLSVRMPLIYHLTAILLFTSTSSVSWGTHI